MFKNLIGVRYVVLFYLLSVINCGNASDVVTYSTDIPSVVIPIFVNVSGFKLGKNGEMKTTPVSGALVTIMDSGLEEGFADKTNLRKRVILKAYKIKPTNTVGYTIAYIMVPDRITSGFLETHSIKIRGTLVVKADGYKPFSESLHSLLNVSEVLDDSRLTFKSNMIPCCEVGLFPIEEKKESKTMKRLIVN